jgi:hypothetical protein
VGEGTTLRIPIGVVRESTGYFIFYAGREARPGEEPMRDVKLDYSPWTPRAWPANSA